MGNPRSLSSSRVTGCRGILMATVDFPAVTTSLTAAFFGRIKVKGPGQNVFIKILAFSGISVAKVST